MPGDYSAARRMDKLREHGREVRRFLKAARELETLGLIEDIGNKTLATLQAELVRRSSPGTGFKQDYPRHGARWEEEEKQQLVALAEAGILDVDAFAQEYQRRPGSVITCMVRLGLLDKADALR